MAELQVIFDVELHFVSPNPYSSSAALSYHLDCVTGIHE